MKIFVAMAAAMLSAGCAKNQVGWSDVLRVGDTLPQFSVTMNDGTMVCTEDLRGIVSLIMLFNTGCGDCRQVLPAVNQLYLEYGIGADDGSGGDSGDDSSDSGDGGSDSGDGGGVVSGSTGQVRFVLIGRNQDYQTVLQYWVQNGYSVPFSPQEDHAVYDLFATYIVPRVFISDPTLTVRYSFDDDPDPTYEDLLSALRSLLDECPRSAPPPVVRPLFPPRSHSLRRSGGLCSPLLLPEITYLCGDEHKQDTAMCSTLKLPITKT